MRRDQSTISGFLLVLCLLGIVGVFLPWLDFMGTKKVGIEGDGVFCLLLLVFPLIASIIGIATKRFSRGSATAVFIVSGLSATIVFSKLGLACDATSRIGLEVLKVYGSGFWLTLLGSVLTFFIGLVVALIPDTPHGSITENASPADGKVSALPAPKESTKKCPECAETVQAEARICRFCSYRFATPDTSLANTEARQPDVGGTGQASAHEPHAIMEESWNAPRDIEQPPSQPIAGDQTSGTPLFQRYRQERSGFPLAILIVLVVGGIATLTWWLVAGRRSERTSTSQVDRSSPGQTKEMGDASRAKLTTGYCTSASQCPEDYISTLPYLEAFCARTLKHEDIELLRSDATKGRISPQSLLMLFNAYGAFYGFDFKRETWLNAFFYGSGEWLPAQCRMMIRSFGRPEDIPPQMAADRDALRTIWQDAGKRGKR